MSRKIYRVLAVAALLFASVGVAEAQLNSTANSVALSMTVGESITISTTPANVTFTYSPAGAGTATASGPITVVTTANVLAGHQWIQGFAWLGSTTAALSGPSSIPASEVFAVINSNPTPMPCTSNGWKSPDFGVAGAFCGGSLFETDNPPAGAFTNTSVLTLSLNNLGAVAPGTYTGVLNIEAEVL
jgi:hypothetical protein